MMPPVVNEYASAGPGPKTPPEIKKMAKRAHGSFLVLILMTSESTSLVKLWTNLSQSRCATTKSLCYIMHFSHWFCPGSTLNGVLFEAWISCAGDWKKSKLYISVTSSTTNQRLGRRRWMTASEMRQRFGDATDAIITRKTGDEELRAKEVRPHPECPLEEAGSSSTLLPMISFLPMWTIFVSYARLLLFSQTLSCKLMPYYQYILLFNDITHMAPQNQHHLC